MTDHFSAQLAAQLSEPAPPPTLKAAVLARVAREAERMAAAPATSRVRPWTDIPVWLWTAVGCALVVGVTAYRGIATGLLPAGFGSGIAAALVSIPIPPEAVTGGLALGLLVYLAGLFAPLRARGRR